jgi:formate/nitrite transporter FocA (FNT family)
MSSPSVLQHSQPEAKKPYRQILIEEISEGQHELDRPPLGSFLSAVSAGLDIGFSLLLMGVVKTMTDGELSRPVVRLLTANMYAVGFIFVVLGRSELFTEHTTLAVLPLINGRSSIASVARLCGIVYAGNMLGAMVFAALTVMVGPSLHIIDRSVLAKFASDICGHSAGAIVLSAIFAGWLMGLMSWLTTAARDTISQLFIVWLIATAIGLAQFHHAVAGAVEVLAGVFVGGVSLGDFAHFLLWTTLGNAIGGTVFVALLKSSHASRGAQPRGKRGNKGAI